MWLIDDEALETIMGEPESEKSAKLIGLLGEPIQCEPNCFYIDIKQEIDSRFVPKRTMLPSFGEDGLEFVPVEFTDIAEGGEYVHQFWGKLISVHMAIVNIFRRTEDYYADIQLMFDGTHHIIIRFDNGCYNVLKSVRYTNNRGRVLKALKDENPTWYIENVNLVVESLEHIEEAKNES